MKLKVGDKESILFMKKSIATKWMYKNFEDVLSDIDEKGYLEDIALDVDIGSSAFEWTINHAANSYFWFTMSYNKPDHDKKFFVGSVHNWKKKKWKVYQGHIKPKVKDHKDQLFIEGCGKGGGK